MIWTLVAVIARMTPACRAGVFFIAVILAPSMFATPALAHAPDADGASGQVSVLADGNAADRHLDLAHSDFGHVEQCGTASCGPVFLPENMVVIMIPTPEITASAIDGFRAIVSTPPPLRPPRINA